MDFRNLSTIDTNLSITDSNIALTKRFLFGGDDATLIWDGQRLKLALVKGDVLFDVTPSEIKKVHVYQRISMRFYVNNKKYLVYYPDMMVRQMSANLPTAVAGSIGAGYAVARMREVALQSPLNVWFELFKKLDIKVWDDSFVPPSVSSLVIWTFAITFGAIFLALFIIMAATAFVGGN
jgi:hypothetical protein